MFSIESLSPGDVDRVSIVQSTIVGLVILRLADNLCSCVCYRFVMHQGMFTPSISDSLAALFSDLVEFSIDLSHIPACDVIDSHDLSRRKQTWIPKHHTHCCHIVSPTSNVFKLLRKKKTKYQLLV